MVDIKYGAAEESNKDEILNFHKQFFEPERKLAMLDWLMDGNPVGNAIYVLAWNQDKIIGTQCILPYWMRSEQGELVLTGKSEDTCVHPEFRGQGIFDDLYSEIIPLAKGRGIKYIWGFTSAIGSFSRVGFEICPAYYLVIRVSGILDGMNTLGMSKGLYKRVKLLGFLFKSVLLNKLKSSLEINEEGREVIEDLIKLEGLQNNSISMSHEYLMWRVWNNPNYENVHCLTYRDGGKLKAYLLFHINQKTAFVIHDCLDKDLTLVKQRSIIAAFTQYILKSGIHVIKNWIIPNAKDSRQIKLAWKEVGYGMIKTGSHFVWLPLEEHNLLSWQSLNLTRIASLGTT